jgi:putative flippase GtrA
MRVWLQSRTQPAVFDLLMAYARAHAPQLIRFVLIGASLAALNLGLLYCFRTRLHLADPIAVTAMYWLGTGLHFAAHRWITYGAQDRPVLPQGARYSLMLVWNFLIMQILVLAAARLSIPAYFAVMASTGFTMVFNFLFMTHVVFTRNRPR